MRMTDQLLQLATIWGDVSRRSLSRLATRVQNDGRFFDRLQETGTCTTKTFEKFLTFFRDAGNWPDNIIPQAALELLDNFENIASEGRAAECHGDDASASAGDAGNGLDHAAANTAADAAPSTGQIGQMSRDEATLGLRKGLVHE